jgi:hypothetical protein
MFSAYPAEHELLLLPGTSFEVEPGLWHPNNNSSSKKCIT